MSPRVSHVTVPLRPRRLRRLLLMIGAGAAIAAAVLTPAAAKAEPVTVTVPEAICQALAADSSDARFQRLYDVLVYEVHLTDVQAGDAIANSVIYRCPEHAAALMRFAYANGTVA